MVTAELILILRFNLDPNLIIEKLMSIFGIRLDQTAITILNCWRKLHWAYQDTYNWEFCK